MLALKDIGDWVEAIIVLVVIAGSALGGIVKAITSKLNRSKEEIEAERELRERRHERHPEPRATQPPPLARPMPPRRPAAKVEHRPVAWPIAQPRAEKPPYKEVPRTVPPAIQTILDVVLDGAVDIEDVFSKPQPRHEAPPAPPRVKERVTGKRPVRRRSIEEREEHKAKLVEKRLGHVEPHVAPAATSAPSDAGGELFERLTRAGLRRAIILNEVLSPPLALRPPN